MTTNHSHIFGRYKPRLHLTEVALHLCPVIYHRLLYVHIPRLRCPKFITSQKIASYLRAPTHLHCHQRALLQKPSADTLGSGCLTQTLDPPHSYTISQGKVSRTEVLSAPWSRDSLFSARKTFLPQVFRICGPHTTQSPTDPTQINKCTPRWPKQLLWAFIQNFWCKTFLKRGRKNPRRKSVYFQGKPDKWYTCK